MKKQNTNPEVQATTTETVNTEKKATKATTKKEEKKMTESKNSETATIIIPESLDQNMLKAYKVNEAGELLMTEDMVKEFFEAHPELKMATTKKDPEVRGIKADAKAKPFATIRLSEDAKKKQVHIHTGATKKVCSQKDEKTNIRYKVIFRAKTEKYEMWSSDGAGKRKMEKRGTQEEVMAEYNKVLGIETEATPKKATRKTTKKSA